VCTCVVAFSVQFVILFYLASDQATHNYRSLHTSLFTDTANTAVTCLALQSVKAYFLHGGTIYVLVSDSHSMQMQKIYGKMVVQDVWCMLSVNL
jgi:hypothetical protein